MKPSGSPVQQHSVKTGMKQHHAHLRGAGFFTRQLTNIRRNVGKHDISLGGPFHTWMPDARSVPNSHTATNGSIRGKRKCKPSVRSLLAGSASFVSTSGPSVMQ